MKKIIITFLMLLFVFSCNGSGGIANYTNSKFEEGIVRVEIEHGDFIGDLKQEDPFIVLSHWNKSMKNLKIKGTDQSFKLDEELVMEAPFPVEYYSATFKTTDKKLAKKLVYETSEKVEGFSVTYGIKYSVKRKSNIDQDIPVKVKLYVDGKLKREGDTVYKIKVDEDGSSHILFTLLYSTTDNVFTLN